METREILEDIINDFSPEKFVRFFRDKSAKFAPKEESLSQYNDENFKDGKKLGEITFAEAEQLAVFAFRANQPLSERSGKKAQYEKGKKILKDWQSDAGIFIFYDDNGNFRFSLIYANYLGKKRDWSAFRRFTYFVSKEYTNKTFLQQIGEENFSSLEKIKDAFSVEKVTKAFYTDIANWYFWAIQKTEFPTEAEKEGNGRNVAVIRLITRLIFIWFMKEKGLIQQDLFNYKNISTLLKDLLPKNTQYYKAILQNLFFATLNTKIEDRKFRFGKSYQGKNKDYMDHGIYRYEDYFKNKEDMLEIFKDIPFLNGGLFDCLDRRITENQKNIEIRIDGFTDKDVGLKVPNVLFFSDEINVDLNKEYGTKNKKYKVRGLIDILSSYNFTIDENDPNDADVALDPELLGKVFENLLASFNPETATTARKATGSYYTPREIVNYMVDESLTAYLSNVIDSEVNIRNLISFTDKPHQFTDSEADTLIRSIDNVKILDPAVGSGAFPMGMLHKLVYILGRLDPDNSKWRELQRQKAIKDTEEAYKIGDKEERQQRLLDINEVFDDNASDYGRKLYLIENCIYGVDIQPIAVQIAKLRFFISLLVDQGINPKKENLGIRPLPNLETKFVAANTLIGIERPAQGLLRNPEINRKETELKQVRERHFTARMPKTKQKCIEDDKKLRAEISELLKKDGFPAGTTEKLANWNPYDQNASADFFDPEWMFGITDGFDVVIGNPPYVEFKKLPAEEKAKFTNYISAKGKYDIYIIFDERSNSLLKSDGVLCFIQPTTFMKKDFGEGIRKFIKQNFKIKTILDFADIQVFDGATNYTGVFIFNKSELPKNYEFDYHQYLNTGKSISIADFQNSLCDNNTSSIKNYLEIKDVELENTEWNFQNDSTNILLSKCSINTKPLSEIAESIFQGIASGKDEVFYVNNDTIKEFKIEKGIIKKLLKGKDIKKYVIDWAGYYVIYPYDKNSQVLSEATLKNDYPNAFEYLKKYRELLKGRDYFDNSSKRWFELWNQRSFENFRKYRIISPEITDKNNFVLSNSFYGNTKTYHIVPKDKSIDNYCYLLGLLNSKLLDFIYKKIATPQAGGFYAYKTQFLSKLPIKEIDKTAQQPFITLVDQILAAKKKDRNANTSTLEQQIDKMVYNLYGLTPEEIEIVESSSKK